MLCPLQGKLRRIKGPSTLKDTGMLDGILKFILRN
jgi:hypothetical protein